MELMRISKAFVLGGLLVGAQGSLSASERNFNPEELEHVVQSVTSNAIQNDLKELDQESQENIATNEHDTDLPAVLNNSASSSDHKIVPASQSSYFSPKSLMNYLGSAASGASSFVGATQKTLASMYEARWFTPVIPAKYRTGGVVNVFEVHTNQPLIEWVTQDSSVNLNYSFVIPVESISADFLGARGYALAWHSNNDNLRPSFKVVYFLCLACKASLHGGTVEELYAQHKEDFATLTYLKTDELLDILLICPKLPVKGLAYELLSYAISRTLMGRFVQHGLNNQLQEWIEKGPAEEAAVTSLCESLRSITNKTLWMKNLVSNTSNETLDLEDLSDSEHEDSTSNSSSSTTVRQKRRGRPTDQEKRAKKKR